MKNKLIPLSDYVLEQHGSYYEYTNNHEKVIMYARFLKQNLSEPYYIDGIKCHPLNRFVPTDLGGNPFTEIDDELCEKVLEKRDKVFDKCMIELAKQYQQAKDRVLFEGWECEVRNGIYFLNHEDILRTFDFVNIKDKFQHWTIESLTEYNLTLTPTGAKMCGKEFEK